MHIPAAGNIVTLTHGQEELPGRLNTESLDLVDDIPNAQTMKDSDSNLRASEAVPLGFNDVHLEDQRAQLQYGADPSEFTMPNNHSNYRANGANTVYETNEYFNIDPELLRLGYRYSDCGWECGLSEVAQAFPNSTTVD
jgi:hypothetical protein